MQNEPEKNEKTQIVKMKCSPFGSILGRFWSSRSSTSRNLDLDDQNRPEIDPKIDFLTFPVFVRSF